MKSVYVRNRLLAGLPARYRNHILRASEQVDLMGGDVRQEPGEAIRFVYFPVSGMISLVIPVEGRGNLEVGLLGTEGFLGITTVLGVPIAAFAGLGARLERGPAAQGARVSPRAQIECCAPTNHESIRLRDDGTTRRICGVR
jgi:hypothetical protein